MNALIAPAPVPVCHVIKGKLVTATDHVYGRGPTRFATPSLDLDSLVWSRQEPGPAFDTPLSEIMDLLTSVGQWLTADPNGLVAEALEHASHTSSLPYPVLKRSYETLGRAFERNSMEFQVRNELGGEEVLDGWKEVHDAPSGRKHRIRAFPPRLIHIMAGNAPGVAAQSVVRGALTKGVHLLKIPSNELFAGTTILRALAAVAPDHPVTRSFSAVYWRGGDDAVESTLFRPQFFDKLVAWGGESSLRSAKKYIGPGFELVAFDPKTSISMIGREAFDSAATLAEAADRGATDATLVEQQACSSSRFQFVEGTTQQVDRYCALLRERMGVERIFATAEGRPLSENLREEIDGLRGMEDFYRVWGGYEGPGVVIRSEDPVEFHPDGRVVNVVPVTSLADAVRFANVATQTVGVYPSSRKAGLRDALAAAGVQRVVELGGAGGVETGLPHDGFFPLQRLVRWVSDEG
jgi:hypothetical protein